MHFQRVPEDPGFSRMQFHPLPVYHIMRVSFLDWNLLLSSQTSGCSRVESIRIEELSVVPTSIDMRDSQGA